MNSDLKNKVKKVKDDLLSTGSFSQNLAFTFSGNIVAILIGLAFTPIFTRIYDPQAYGIFSFFLALTQNLGSLATLQLTRAFVLPKMEKNFLNLLTISILSAVGFCLVLLLILLVFGDWILIQFDESRFSPFLLLLPLAILLYSFQDIFQSWAVRVKAFKKSSQVKVGSSIISRFFTLGYGLLKGGLPLGLIVGDLLQKLADIILLTGKKISLKPLAKKINLLELRNTLREYKAYPYFILPNHWINSLSLQLPVYFIMFGFDSEMVGHYSLANRLLGIPAMIIVSSLAPVFLQRITEEFHNSKENIPLLLGKLVHRLLLITLIPFTLLMAFSTGIFEVFLGSQWTMAGDMAFFLGIYYPFFILGGSMQSIFRIFAKEKLLFTINLFSILLIALTLWIGLQTENIYLTLGMYGVINIFTYSFQVFSILRISGFNRFKWMVGALLLFIGTVLIIGAYRFSALI